ncbi:hypothetical protein QDW93_08880 [Escherichia coli]|nr:hypothetical protein QDW93_08880 [Escherichia coli]
MPGLVNDWAMLVRHLCTMAHAGAGLRWKIFVCAVTCVPPALEQIVGLYAAA